MNRSTLTLTFSFVFLVLVQVMVFNNISLFGYVNPMIYLLFLVIYRFDNDQTLLIFLSFILGFLNNQIFSLYLLQMLCSKNLMGNQIYYLRRF